MDLVKSQLFEPTQTEVSFFVRDDGEHMTQARETFKVLGLSKTNITNTLERHVFPEYRQRIAIGRGMPAWYLTYEGVIQLVMVSAASHARSFQRWVFSVIKSIIKTGQYTATAEDQQHFQPFGLTLQRKIEECDRAIPTAEIGTGKIAKILSDRKALEAAYREEVPKEIKQNLEKDKQSVLEDLCTLMDGQAMPAREMIALSETDDAWKTVLLKISNPISSRGIGLFLRQARRNVRSNVLVDIAPKSDRDRSSVKWKLIRCEYDRALQNLCNN